MLHVLAVTSIHGTQDTALFHQQYENHPLRAAQCPRPTQYSNAGNEEHEETDKLHIPTLLTPRAAFTNQTHGQNASRVLSDQPLQFARIRCNNVPAAEAASSPCQTRRHTPHITVMSCYVGQCWTLFRMRGLWHQTSIVRYASASPFF